LILPASARASGEPGPPFGHGETLSATLAMAEPLTPEWDSRAARAEAGAQAEAPAEAARAEVVPAPMMPVVVAAVVAAAEA
jgi:hypothetical protein